MQLLGVYLKDGDKSVIKNLKKGCWYPFGNFSDDEKNDIFNAKTDKIDFENLEKALKKQQVFNSVLYSVKSKDIEIPINISCIVGKNGSGKSSLLNLVYRIINNFSCKIKTYLKNYNQDYNPIWATGFDADLYYELDGKVYCLSVRGNSKLNTEIKEGNSSGALVGLFEINENKTETDILFSEIEKLQKSEVTEDEIKKEHRLKKENDFLKFIGEKFFYTVGTNYSLYSNSVVTDKWDRNEEKWLGNIFHKNDGYFTPVVLVPYKNEWTTIDTKKELDLAKERVSTLALLVYAQTGNNFIEGLVPDKICYAMIEETEYRGKSYSDYPSYISQKLRNTIEEYYEYREKENPLDMKESNVNIISRDIDVLNRIEDAIKKIWETKLFTKEREHNYRESFESEDKDSVFQRIKENTLAYLSYKTIKICLYYDVYKNEFPKEYDHDILIAFLKDFKKGKSTVSEVINGLFVSEKFKLNFTNLKIKQCITFLQKLDFYVGKKSLFELLGTNKRKNEKQIDDFVKNLTKQNLTFDSVFENLPPPYFKKQVYFNKIEHYKEDGSNLVKENNITISSLSSGESQLLNSMSYAVYHIKNALSSKIGYKNINLIFDEAELYYHPEYQRTFIKDLLGIIERSNLHGVNGINITIVTHSPFILSDIPSQNLLCLQNGERKRDALKNTLGANYYDLLKNQFFMDSSIGGVVEGKINDILIDFNKFQQKDISKKEKEEISSKYKNDLNKANSKEYKNFYDSFINNLGDEYLKSTVQNLIGIMRGENYIDRRIAELDVKMKRLEECKKA